MRFLPPRLLSTPGLIALWLAASLLSGWLAYQSFVRRGLTEAQAAGDHRLQLYASGLQREADRFAFLPGVVLLQTEVEQLLQHPEDADLKIRANQYLEALNGRAGTLSVYVLDRKGQVLAASNWQRPDSFVGEDLSFRPYVQQALSKGQGRYFGIGTTRAEPGYYLTTRWNQGEQQGVVVVKVGLAQLEQFWARSDSPVLVSDENKVVILSNVEAWRFAMLEAVDEERRRALQASLQYNGRTLEPLDWQWLAGTADTRQVRLSRDAAHDQQQLAGQFLVQTRALEGSPWHVTVLSPLSPTLQLAQSRAWLVGAVTALVLLLLQFVVQRRKHHQALKDAHLQASLQAHIEAQQVLELKVQQRTAELQKTNMALQQEVAERAQAEQTLRAAQDELVQAGKLAVIGQLSTEVAHELNQPLAALRALAGNSQRFLERGQSDMVQRNLQRMAELADRMGGMTSQLRNFARKSAGAAQAVFVSSLIDGALAVLEVRLERSGTALQCTQPPDLQAWCNANRVQQVLVNLLSNALDAMQDSSAPQIDIDCQQAGPWVEIAVRDHGPGLDAQTLQHLFEPFFTTKPEGQGLGLGLSLSAEIARAGGGLLKGRNHPEGGAIFTLSLPLVDTQPLS